MSPPTQRDGPSSREGAAPQNSATTKRHQVQGNPNGQPAEIVAVAYLSPPIGRRGLPLLVVVDCPACHHVHTHRGRGGRRVGSCGASYLLRVAGTKRARWAS